MLVNILSCCTHLYLSTRRIGHTDTIQFNCQITVCQDGMHHICSTPAATVLLLCGILIVGEGWVCQYEIITLYLQNFVYFTNHLLQLT
jgi:hypothetical protein